MEGTAMEMRYNTEIIKEYGIDVKSVVATGGGANSKKWLQLKSNIQNIPVSTLRSSEGGLCGCAMLQAVALGGAKDLDAAAEIFIVRGSEYTPDIAENQAYEGQYNKYKKLYQTVKEMF